MRLELPDGWIDLAAGEVVRGGFPKPLGPVEVRFLTYLALRPGRAVPLAELHSEVWQFAPRVRTRAIYFAVRKLREMVEPNPKDPVLLVGTEGRGFLFRSSRAPGGNLLVGREAELARIGATVDAPGALVVVTGPSGIGKSRLLVEVARSLGAVGSVDAEGAVDARELAAAIARGLGAELGADPVERTRALLASRVGDGVLILDHLDQAGPDALAALAGWRRAAPRMRIVAASQGSIPFGDAQHLVLEPLVREDARSLFLARLAAGGRTIDVDATDLDGLLDQLDGLPLAIGLAAVRARTLPLSRIREELATEPESLAAPLADAVPRHHTLAAAIESSLGGLSDPERAGLARLCAIDTALPLDPALAVLADLGGSTTLSGLIDRGLVRTNGSGAEVVYSPLDGVRRYLRSRAAGDGDDAIRRLVAWWSESPGRTRAVLRAAHQALVQAATALVSQGDAAVAPLVAACLQFAIREGVTGAHERLADQVLDLQLEPRVRAGLVWLQAVLLAPRDIGSLRQALAELEATGTAAQVVEAATHLAQLLAGRDDVATSELLERARPLAEASGMQWAFEIAAGNLARSRGDLAEAQRCAERAVAASADARQEARALGQLGEFRSELGYPEESLALALRASEILGEDADPRAAAAASWRLAFAYRSLGRFEASAEAFRRVREIVAPIDPQWDWGTAVNLVILALEAGWPERAQADLLELISDQPLCDRLTDIRVLHELVRLRLGEPPRAFDTRMALGVVFPKPLPEEIEALAWCAEIAFRSGDAETGAEHLAAAEERMARTDLSPTSDAGRALAFVRALPK